MTAVEDRDDLEKLLLEGLPDDERRHTEDTIAQEAARKLARLRDEASLSEIPAQPTDEDSSDLEEA